MNDERLGHEFADALAGKDARMLKDLLHPDVDFSALTPGRFWEAHRADVVVDETILGTWFGPDRHIVETLAIDGDTLGPMQRVGYRFRVTRPDGEFVIEQQAYLGTDGGRIRMLRIVCSGFIPVGGT